MALREHFLRASSPVPLLWGATRGWRASAKPSHVTEVHRNTSLFFLRKTTQRRALKSACALCLPFPRWAGVTLCRASPWPGGGACSSHPSEGQFSVPGGGGGPVAGHCPGSCTAVCVIESETRTQHASCYVFLHPRLEARFQMPLTDSLSLLCN